MRTFRRFLRIILVLSILIWTVAFLLGSGVGIAWTLGSIAAYTGPVSAVILIVMSLANLGARPQDIRRKAGETLKCVECGRPSVPGSRYCRYHLDIMKDD